MGLTGAERASWERDGYVIVREFLPAERLQPLIDRVVDVVRAADRGVDVSPAIPTIEKALADDTEPEDRTSKLFRIARQEPLFRAIANDPNLLERVADLIDGDFDCFLSQFIFKQPGALGQPWHQDSFYFRMDHEPQIGAWLAVTAATIDNGPLWVVPGSHREEIHEDFEWDTREHAGDFYVEIQGADTSSEVPVLMDAGDLLVFHSRLRHRSTDNGSTTSRAAMVYHYGSTAITQRQNINQDWFAVWRDRAPC